SPDITISHLLYANDVVITTECKKEDLDNIIRVLHVFYLASGLRINIHKSNIYCIGVSDEEVSDMASSSGCVAGSFPLSYLGIPMESNKNHNWSRIDVGVRNMAYLCDMLLEISLVDTHPVEDSCLWSMENDSLFSVGVSRRIIDSKLLPSLVPSTSWDKILPRKVNIFIWRLSLDRLPHRLNISSCGIDIPKISCSSCNGNMESSNHIFFACDIAMEV
nr:RNA-directed DNA polymerase, eukaryota [Tanacetum cinerariifolium]